MTATRRQTLTGFAASGASLIVNSAAAGTEPRRVVSLNACLDAILVHVADRGQIAALSHYAREPAGSTIVEVARTLPFTWETAEEVIALRPDLVLTSRHSALATRNALGRLGVRTELFSVPESVEASLAQVREVARLVGRPERGESLVARVEAALAAGAAPPAAPRLKALVYQPNGFAAGKGTLMDEMMTRAGFDNVAGRYGLGKWGNVPIERLLADPPQVLLSGVPVQSSRTWADRVMRHPALAALSGRMVQAQLDEKLLYCGGPVLIRTAAALARAHREALEAIA
ncbi:ABC transporter substrate-binding protein [Brevundimonas faecalis]|uniref:ABC transporter substrate-binding protein n=1 Tax=Brevundimonas faecalis TaxID=947378 RepID=UPI003622E013